MDLYTFDGYPKIDEHKSMYTEAMEFLKKNKTVAFIMDFRKNERNIHYA